MKPVILLLFIITFSVSSFACDCAGERSFCNHIQQIVRDGIVCIVEPTGNVEANANYEFSATEMKIIDLLYGFIQPGNGNYLNSDSTIWILSGSGAACYEGGWMFEAGNQYVIAPTYGNLFPYSSNIETGYSIFSCTRDFFPYENPMIGPMINDYQYFPYFVTENDTITTDWLPQLVDNCSCVTNLSLPDPHDFPFVYSANSTILSSANVNADVIYKASDRITLYSGFKTEPTVNFGIVMDGCD